MGAQAERRRGAALKLLVTGTREGRHDVETWLARWQRKHGAPEVLIVGGARGVDTQAELFGLRVGWRVLVVPADWKRLGRGAGYERNKEMVRMCGPGDHVLGFPDPRLPSRGTRQCIDFARAAGLTVFVLPPLARAALDSGGA